MFTNLGLHWASSIPAFLALACLPFPFLFYKYGESIRLRCKFAAEAADVLQRMRTRADDEEDAPADHPRGHAGGVLSDSSSASSLYGEEDTSAPVGDEEKKIG